MERRYVILEDGTVFDGVPYGADREAQSEIVFTTAMTGYLEAITDPSYEGQMLVFASPTIANYSLSAGKMESERARVSGVITRDAHSVLGAGKPGDEFEEFLERNGVPGVDLVDTRALVRHIREKGAMKAVISDSKEFHGQWVDTMSLDLVGRVCRDREEATMGSGRLKCLYIDVGSKFSLREQMARRFTLHTVNYDHDFSAIDIDDYDLLFISNGPGDPAHQSLRPVVNFVQSCIGRVPTFGVCLGHQIIAQAYGASTRKMKFGHRGSNHAVTDGRRSIVTTHNHGYAVDPDTLKGTGLKVLQWDVNDGTVEAMEDRARNVYSVQYHPEASPGPHDASAFFDSLIERVGD